MGVFARLAPALVFKTSGGFEQSSQWVRFPYTPAIYICRHLVVCASKRAAYKSFPLAAGRFLCFPSLRIISIVNEL